MTKYVGENEISETKKKNQQILIVTLRKNYLTDWC